MSDRKRTEKLHDGPYYGDKLRAVLRGPFPVHKRSIIERLAFAVDDFWDALDAWKRRTPTYCLVVAVLVFIFIIALAFLASISGGGKP